MNEAASELQGTFNEFILFAIYYEMCNKSQTVYFFLSQLLPIFGTE